MSPYPYALSTYVVPLNRASPHPRSLCSPERAQLPGVVAQMGAVFLGPMEVQGRVVLARE